MLYIWKQETTMNASTIMKAMASPIMLNRFSFRLINTQDKSELGAITTSVTAAKDDASRLGVTLSWDDNGLAILDYIKLRKNIKDYIAVIEILKSDGTVGGTWMYEELKVTVDPLVKIDWDYASNEALTTVMVLSYATRLYTANQLPVSVKAATL